MAIYKYRAKKDPQNMTEGKVEANSEKEAIEKINFLGLIPVQIEQESQGQQQSGGVSFAPNQRVKLRGREITVFSRQLASLLKSGVPILKSLNIIAEQSDSPVLKSTLGNIYKEVEAGMPFSSVLSQYPRVFSSLYIAMIRAGENSGALPEVLLKITDYRAKEEDMLSRFRMAMAYPILMACVGLGTIIFMLTFVMPRLTSLYSDMGQALPVPTKILIFASKGLQSSWALILFVLFLVGIIVKRYSLTKAGRASFSLLALHIPIFGTLSLKAELARFSRTLELLLRSGISILRALNIAIPILGNEIIKEKLSNSYKELEQGGSLGRSLKNAKIIPLFMSNLITVGEESGKLDQALTELAASYERDTDEAIRMMSSLLEPVMILGMGLIVGFIVVAMMLPIFEINTMVR
jgi:type II secretory pathway component PulF